MGKAPKDSKIALFASFAQIGKALASASRLELVDLLTQAPRTVEALAMTAGLSVANTSAHLKVLREAGLVSATKRGLFVTYRLAGANVEELFVMMRSLASTQIAGVERARAAYLRAPHNMERIDASTLRERVRDQSITLVDVRPPEEFAASHLPDALSIPLKTLSERLGSLPRDREVVAYCRGPYCVYAVEAVDLLTRHGFAARLYEGGVTGWRQHGLTTTALSGTTST